MTEPESLAVLHVLLNSKEALLKTFYSLIMVK